jgi:hypothetical protein
MPSRLISSAAHQPVTIYGSYAGGTMAGLYFVAVQRSGKPEVIGQFTVPAGHQGGTFAKRAYLPPGAYTAGGSGNADGDISIYSGTFDLARQAWTVNAVDSVITANLNSSTAIPQPAPVGAAVWN